jgi:hypothetical protein
MSYLKFFYFSIGIRNFSISRSANYLPSNGYYQFIPSIGIPWTTAKVLAASSFIMIRGYLATITAADEAKYQGEQAEELDWRK